VALFSAVAQSVQLLGRSVRLAATLARVWSGPRPATSGPDLGSLYILPGVRVLIVGCGRVGARLALELAAADHQVTVVDSSREAFDRLGKNFPGRIVLGNGTDQHVLEEAKAAETDWFISVTNGDNRNIMSAQVAKEIFKIPRVMTRIYDPIRERVYREMGLYTYCPTVVGAAIARTFFEEGPEAADRARAAVTITSGGADG